MCDICGAKSLNNSDRKKILYFGDQTKELLLCEGHQNELFRLGQRLFLKKYEIEVLVTRKSKNSTPLLVVKRPEEATGIISNERCETDFDKLVALAKKLEYQIEVRRNSRYIHVGVNCPKTGKRDHVDFGANGTCLTKYFPIFKELMDSVA